MIPSHSSALENPAHIVGNRPLVLPLPQSLFDMRGRDLLFDPQHRHDTQESKDSRAARRDAYIKEIEASPIDVTCEMIVAWIYRDMSITFFGNPRGAERRGTIHTGISIANSEERRFIPVVDGGMYYAEYAYFNENNNIRASFRTDNINLELPPESSWPTGATRVTLPDFIRLEPIPTMSFTPSAGSFRIGTEGTLPTATVSIHQDSGIKFDATNTLTSFTYIAVRYRLRGENDRAWRWLGLDANGNMIRRADGTLGLPIGTDEDDERIMRITDFKFTPEDVGDYQFWYYTTTIFGVGSKTDLTAAQIRDRIHSFEGREFFKTQPFDNIVIERNNVAPEIMWTVDFDYRPSEPGSNVETWLPWYDNTYLHRDNNGTTTKDPALALIVNGVRQVAPISAALPEGGWGKPLIFEDAPDHRQWLPGSTAASRTKIQAGESLVIPALLGHSPVNATPSHLLQYELFIYRHRDGIRSEDNVMWASGLHGNDSEMGGGVWNHTRTFHIPFTPDAFSTGILSNFRGFTPAGTYDIMVRAFDSDNNLSGQYQYTFTVVEPIDWAPTRPRLNGLFRAGQNEYHEGDTLRFNVASFTDDSTDDRDIEVRYFISLDNGRDIERLMSGASGTHAIEIKDGEEGVTISGGVFVLSDENEIGKRIIDELSRKDEFDTPVHSGFLTFRIYAIARNYHAITRNDNF
jgi:hypothetical protein